MNDISGMQPNLEMKFPNWYVITEDPQDLYTYMRYGKNGRSLILNRKEDNETYSDYPYSIIYKLYEPLPDEIEEGSMIYVTRNYLILTKKRYNY